MGPSSQHSSEAAATPSSSLPPPSPSSSSPTFLSLGLPSHLHGKLINMKITVPTPVQAAALPPLLTPLEQSPPDAIVHAETGTGKTLAYLLPIFARLEPRIVPHARLRAIIVTPTRELSLQVSSVAELLGAVGAKKDPSKAVKVRRVVGEATAQLLHELKVAPPHVLVGTPTTLSRLVPAHINLGELQVLVLDEADELLRNHSAAAVSALVKTVRKHSGRPGIVAVSATSSFGLQKFAAEHLRKPVIVDTTGGVMATPSTLAHYMLRYPAASAAYNTFTRFLAAARPPAVLSFHNSAASMEALETHLRSKGIPVAVLGNAYTNAQRASALDGVRSGRVRVLLSTEMAARGLDLPRISHVVNFDPPASTREYVHRAGRAGRMSSLTPGREGMVLTFVGSDEEENMVVNVATRLGVGLSNLEVEGGEVRTSSLVDAVVDRGAHVAKLLGEGKLRVARRTLAGGGGGGGEGDGEEGIAAVAAAAAPTDSMAAALRAAQRATA
jgi:ATP-dependent RNA helicase DeaD